MDLAARSRFRLRARRRNTEYREQVGLINWSKTLFHKYPQLSLLYAIPNGELRDKITATKLKVQGVKPGVPDLCLPWPSGGYHGLYIELKSETGRLTAAQKEWIESLREAGYAAVVCYGWLQAAETIMAYLRGEPLDKRQ